MAHPAPSRVERSIPDRLWAIGLGGIAVRRWPLVSRARRRLGVAEIRAAIDRTGQLIPPSRLVVVLARGHEHDADGIPGIHRVVQPAYRGSAVELFLPLSLIARHDRSAIVVALPADGVGQDEPAFLATLVRAAEAVAERPDLVVALGLAPPCPRGAGWIEPGAPMPGLVGLGVREVRRFVRRPRFAQAAALRIGGGLVDTGVMVAAAETWLALGRRRLPDVLETLEPVQAALGRAEEHLLCEAVYEAMPYADLAHALLARDETFGVLAVPRTRTRVRPAASA
jgi:mannose-1-phosphate guanylyltransferase